MKTLLVVIAVLACALSLAAPIAQAQAGSELAYFSGLSSQKAFPSIIPANPLDCMHDPKAHKYASHDGISSVRTEYYECGGDLMAVIEHGRKTDGKAVIYGFASNAAQARSLGKTYPGSKFLYPGDKDGRKHLEKYLALRSKRLNWRL